MSFVCTTGLHPSPPPVHTLFHPQICSRELGELQNRIRGCTVGGEGQNILLNKEELFH